MYAGLAAGVLLCGVLIAWNGAGEVIAALRTAGFGLIGVSLFHLVPLAADAFGWRQLVPTSVPLRTVVLARWIGESVNGLLPVLQLGGNVVKAHVLVRHGVDATTAAASVVVDVTLMIFTLVLFACLGVVVLVARLEGGALLGPALIGLATMGAAVVAFYVVQRRGVFATLAGMLQRLGGASGKALLAEAAAVDVAVDRLYRDRGAVARATAWHLLSWIVGLGEVWLALWCFGHPVDIVTAFLIESLGQAIRAAGVVVPGAIGVQEGGFVLLGGLFGIGPETSLALSLAKRVREVVLGIPGLIAWQLDGATSWFRARS